MISNPNDEGWRKGGLKEIRFLNHIDEHYRKLATEQSDGPDDPSPGTPTTVVRYQDATP